MKVNDEIELYNFVLKNRRGEIKDLNKKYEEE